MRNVMLVAVLALASSGGAWASNVLLFTIDSCRADRFGILGRQPSPTPRIDDWARGGTVFANAYSTSAWTAPGLVSILSGLYPPTHAVNNRDQTGSPDLPTLIKLLAAEGYRIPNLNFFTFAPYYKNLGLGPVQREYFGPEPGEEAVRWLEQNGGAEGEEPFLLWYHTTLAHQPYNPPQPLLKRPKAEFRQRPALRAIMEGAIVPIGSVRFQEGDQALLDELYDAEVSRVDALFGRLLDTLEKLGRLEDTLIVVTADHGEELLDHGFVGHASTSLQAKLYEEHVRIPLMMSWPGRVPAGRLVETRASQIDVLPTVLRLLEVDPPDHLDGHDLLADTVPARSLFFESVISGNQTTREHEDIWVRAVLRDRHKFVSTEELYDLEEDPRETRNLVDQKPELAEGLRTELAEWLRQSEAARGKLFERPPTRRTRAASTECPVIVTPSDGQTLSYDLHTGAILLDWQGDLETSYLIEYDIGTGDHHVAGVFEVQGNHHLFGPLGTELWQNLKAWNPFRIRVAPKTPNPCWSPWVSFQF